MNKPTISASAAARKLGCCVASVHRFIEDGTLQAYQLTGPHGHWQIIAASLDRLVKRRQKKEKAASQASGENNPK